MPESRQVGIACFSPALCTASVLAATSRRLLALFLDPKSRACCDRYRRLPPTSLGLRSIFRRCSSLLLVFRVRASGRGRGQEPDTRFIRRMQRDIAERGRTVDEVVDQYLGTVRPMHDTFVTPSKVWLDALRVVYSIPTPVYVYPPRGMFFFRLDE